MHSNSYNIKVGCISSENFIKSLEEVKSFFAFKLVSIDEQSPNLIDNSYNALIVEGKLKDKNFFSKIKIPKILIQDKDQKKVSTNSFELILKLPINIIEFNQTIVDFSKKYEFDKRDKFYRYVEFI